MKHRYLTSMGGTLLLSLGLSLATQAQDQPAQANSTSAFETRDTTTRKGYTLIVVNKAKDLDTTVISKMVEAFFTVYPQEAAIYNRKTLKKVTFVYDPAYTGVAECGGGVITYSPTWLKQNPQDIDMVTHEGMHIVQDYPGDAGPGWVTEGIADYVRHTLGVNNAAANWSLPAYAPQHHYENAYRVTARFFVWLEKNKKRGIVKTLDTAMRNKKYTEAIWKQLTGKTVDELWKEYSVNSTI